MGPCCVAVNHDVGPGQTLWFRMLVVDCWMKHLLVRSLSSTLASLCTHPCTSLRQSLCLLLMGDRQNVPGMSLTMYQRVTEIKADFVFSQSQRTCLVHLICMDTPSLPPPPALHASSAYQQNTKVLKSLHHGHDAGPELLTHMADGLPTGKSWLRGGDSLPSPSCTQGPCKSRSVRKISCTLDGDVVSISYNRKVSPLHFLVGWV